VHGIRVTCKDLTFAILRAPAVFEHFNLEVTPGEKVGIYADQHDGQNHAGQNLGGLESPTSGVIRYNGVDLRHLNLDSVNRFRGFILDSKLSLFEGTLEENISCSDGSISPTAMCDGRYASPNWKRKSMPCRTASKPTSGLPERFSPRRTLRASWSPGDPGAAATPHFRGILHNMHPAMRETILRRLCSKEEPWSVIFVSNDPNLTPHVDRRIMLN
jgi:putative ABC transport system ATP-binding protein